MNLNKKKLQLSKAKVQGNGIFHLSANWANLGAEDSRAQAWVFVLVLREDL